MLLTQDDNPSQFYIKKISLNQVDINHTIYTQNMIVMPHKLIENWRPQNINQLIVEDFECVLKEKIDIVLLGIGEFGARLPAELYVNLLAKKLVIECMSLSAAARTYSILSAEGRSVAAALLFHSN